MFISQLFRIFHIGGNFNWRLDVSLQTRSLRVFKIFIFLLPSNWCLKVHECIQRSFLCSCCRNVTCRSSHNYLPCWLVLFLCFIHRLVSLWSGQKGVSPEPRRWVKESCPGQMSYAHVSLPLSTNVNCHYLSRSKKDAGFRPLRLSFLTHFMECSNIHWPFTEFWDNRQTTHDEYRVDEYRQRE